MARAGIMLCQPFEEKRLEKWKPPYVVQPKLDGERCRAVYQDGDWTLYSSEMNVIVSVPHIYQALHKQQLPHDVELDGELYLHNTPFEQIHSIVGRTVNIHEEHESIQFHVFDLVSMSPQHERLVQLKSLNLHPPLYPVAVYICFNLYDVMEAYDRVIERGYEGIVVRHIDNFYERKRSTFMMKFKPKKSDYYKIIGWKEEVSIYGDPKGRLGALVCCSDDGTEFSVGSGLNDDNRRAMWEFRDTLPGKLCHVKYQHTTPGKGVPRFPVFVEVIETDPLFKFHTKVLGDPL